MNQKPARVIKTLVRERMTLVSEEGKERDTICPHTYSHPALLINLKICSQSSLGPDGQLLLADGAEFARVVIE